MPAFELFNAVTIKAGGFLRPFYPFFYRFHKRIGVIRFVVSFSYYFCSFSVTTFGWVILNQRLETMGIVGMAIILAAVTGLSVVRSR